MTGFVSRADLVSVLPEIVLAVTGSLLLILEAFFPSTRKAFAALSILAVGGYVVLLNGIPSSPTFLGTLDGSMISRTFGLFFGLCAILTLLVARPYMDDADGARLATAGGEFYALVLWGVVGVSLMARGLDLLVIFLGLETFSICYYILAAFFRKVEASAEAGLKYFLTGAFASSFTLFGIAILFGNAGSTNIAMLGSGAGGLNAWLAVGLVFLLAGFGFKVSLAPFHSWAPDVYAGMPTPAVAFLSVAPKGAALLVLYRIFAATFHGSLPGNFQAILAAVAVLSMCLGNLVALAQNDIKRLLAYSGIAHMGYVAIALAVLGREALAAVVIYLFAYAVTNIGAFAAVAALYKDETKRHTIGLLAGYGRKAPFAAFVLAICMISLAGIPATAGFMGKFFVFKAAIGQGLLWLAIVGVINSLVSLGYYLRVVYVLYMREPIDDTSAPRLAPESWLALAICLAGVFLIGLFPARLLEIAQGAARALPLLRP